ncbi:helix-turn-helix domain-containing protein [Longimicrobium sp.]|jgi:ribosome-binding protein aMBF1 (putative translation factor)|uniref:helix-turn-helix domain-containing protein n=1 Tax=Longimicrobium sp. TaxID=2029185 RepID=UPI002ED9B121
MNDTIQNSASDVLRRRYIKDDPRRAAAVQTERINAEIAQLIYDQRTAAGLTQKQLAALVGTRQSVISRLEDADYEGHSLGMLQRIDAALDQRLHVSMTPIDHTAAA